MVCSGVRTLKRLGQPSGFGCDGRLGSAIYLQQDGSVEIRFGPEKPADVADAALIQTIPGRNFLVALRLYGTEDAFYDQTRKPEDVVKVK